MSKNRILFIKINKYGDRNEIYKSHVEKVTTHSSINTNLSSKPLNLGDGEIFGVSWSLYRQLE